MCPAVSAGSWCFSLKPLPCVTRQRSNSARTCLREIFSAPATSDVASMTPDYALSLVIRKVRQTKVHRDRAVVGQPLLPILAGLAKHLHAQARRLHPLRRRPTGQDVIDEALATPARAGLPLGGARQRRHLAQRGDHLVLAIHPAVEVAEHDE